MFSLLWRALTSARTALSRLRKLGARVFLALTVVQAALVGVLVAMDEIRKRRQGPREGFPWVDQPEVEVEAGGDRLKIYPYGVRLYEAMLEEIEGAEHDVFLGTFIWKGDEVGRRFVEALARKAREGVRVCVIFDGLANVVVPPAFKRFPEEIHTLHFRPLWGPVSLADPRNIFRYHRHLLSVDGRVAFLGSCIARASAAGTWQPSSTATTRTCGSSRYAPCTWRP
jgi:cardiolipin synthase